MLEETVRVLMKAVRELVVSVRGPKFLEAVRLIAETARVTVVALRVLAESL